MFTFQFYPLLETLLQAQKQETEIQQKKVDQLNKEYEKLKVLLQQTQQARSRRVKNGTTFAMVNDSSNSTRFHRRKETSDILY